MVLVNIKLYSALRELERKYLENLGIKKIKWSEEVTNEVLERLREKGTPQNNILRRKAYRIGHTQRRNCLLHDVIEGQMTEVK